LKGLRPFKHKFPPYAKNTSPYYGEGETGGEVDKDE
jgi:hypothetical protein